MQGQRPEQRRHQRIRFRHCAWLELADRRLPCELLDISLRGAMLQAQDAALPGLHAQVTLLLQLDAANTIRLPGEVAHRNGTLLGITATHIDLDSLSHLRRLLELHLSSPALLQRELSELILPHEE